MAKYTFICEKCQHQVQKYTKVAVKSLSCENCDGEMKRQLPQRTNQQVTETIDKHAGSKWKQDQKEMVHERRDDYYWSKMVPKLVCENSLQTCLDNGWVYYDEKGKLQIYTKPPGRR